MDESDRGAKHVESKSSVTLFERLERELDHYLTLRKSKPGRAYFLLLLVLLTGLGSMAGLISLLLRSFEHRETRQQLPSEKASTKVAAQLIQSLDVHDSLQVTFSSASESLNQFLVPKQASPGFVTIWTNASLLLSKAQGVTNGSIGASSNFKLDGDWFIELGAIRNGQGATSSGLRAETKNGWISVYFTTVGARERIPPLPEIYGAWYVQGRHSFGNGEPFGGDSAQLWIRRKGSILHAGYFVKDDIVRVLIEVDLITGPTTIEIFSTQEKVNGANTETRDSTAFDKFSAVAGKVIN